MRLMILAALAAIAIPATASAQAEPPPMTGPFYITGVGQLGTSLVAMGTRKREGDRASITRIIMRPQGVKAGETLMWRIDATAEYDCSTGLTRPAILAARGERGEIIMVSDPKQPFGPLPSVDASAPIAMKVACDGLPPPGEKPIPDFDAWQVQYRRDNAAAR